MIEVINQELLKLQQELNKFQSSIKAINKSNELSENIIESSKALQETYKEHLNKIENLFSEYMNKTYRHSEEKITNIFEGFKSRIDKEEETLSKLTKLSEQNEQLVSEALDKITKSHKDLVEKNTTENINILKEQKEYIALQINELNKNIDKLVDNHNQKLEKEQQVLDNYVELASSTAELSKFLKSVDFPKRLDKLDSDFEKVENDHLKTDAKIDDNSHKLDEIKSDTQKIVEDTKLEEILVSVNKLIADGRLDKALIEIANNKKRLKTTRFYSVLTLIILVLFISLMIFVFFTLFPHFIEDMI